MTPQRHMYNIILQQCVKTVSMRYNKLPELDSVPSLSSQS